MLAKLSQHGDLRDVGRGWRGEGRGAFLGKGKEGGRQTWKEAGCMAGTQQYAGSQFQISSSVEEMQNQVDPLQLL